MYSAFIDLKRAFDSVYRNGLWYKIIKNGLDGKLFDLIKSIYSEVKLCVKNKIHSPTFLTLMWAYCKVKFSPLSYSLYS